MIVEDDRPRTQTLIASVRKALQVLDFISTNMDGFEVKEIAYGVKLNLSTCYHILNTLLHEEYLTKRPDGRYTLGPKIPQLFNAFNRTATPVLEVLNDLQQDTQETAYLVGVREQKIIIQSAIESSQMLRVTPLYVGYSENHHARAISKVIISYWGEEEIRLFFSECEFPKFTDKTPLTVDDLMIQMNTIRSQGYSEEEEEFQIGVCCVAAPIFGAMGRPIGAFGLTVPKERYLLGKSELIEKVTTAAKKVSIMAGFTKVSNYKTALS